MEGSQPAALRFYKTLRAETADQLKNLKATALKVAGIEMRGEGEGFGKPQEDEQPYNSGLATNSNMLNNMMRKRGEEGRAYMVEDTVGNQMVEGTSKAWLQNQQQGAMASQPPPPWAQQNEMPGVRLFPDSFGPSQPLLPRGSQFPPSSSFPQPGMPPGRPILQSQAPGMRPSPDSFPPFHSQPPRAMAMAMPEQYRPPVSGFPGAGPLAQSNDRPMNQPFLARPSQPEISAGSSQIFLPRGFQQQMSSMPQPPVPNWPGQVPSPRPMMPPGNFGQGTSHVIHASDQARFPSMGVALPSPSAMIVGRQQAGPATPAAMHFTAPRIMQAPPASGGAVLNPMQQLASQMQQMRIPQQGARPPMQPQMAPIAVPRAPPQMAMAQQNFLRPPAVTRPPQMGMGPQNLNRAPALQQQLAGPRVGLQRPM